MKYSNSQKKAYDLALSGENIFLTGKAGTGKSKRRGDSGYYTRLAKKRWAGEK